MSPQDPTTHPPCIIATATQFDADALVALYASVGWTAYTRDPDALLAAVEGSDLVVTARAGESLVGLARAISDGVSIVYIQDILVRESHQGRGIGTRLLQAVVDHYPQVRQKVLLTDDRPEQLRFYAALGFHNTRDLHQTRLNAFVRIEDADLA